MGKKMKLPFPFKTSESWPWRQSCGIANPKTHSFRADVKHNNIPKPVSSSSAAYYSVVDKQEESMCSEFPGGECLDYVENVIRGLRGTSEERLFFEPASKLLEGERIEESSSSFVVLKESVEMEMVSSDPFVDFRGSMEEMVEAAAGYNQDWKFLEQLLCCYLRINGKSNHGYIVGAFVDLLVHLFMDQTLVNQEQDTILASSSSSFASSSNTCAHSFLSSSSTTIATHTSTSPLSFCSNLSLLEEADDDDETDKSIHHHQSSLSSSSPSPSPSPSPLHLV